MRGGRKSGHRQGGRVHTASGDTASVHSGDDKMEEGQGWRRNAVREYDGDLMACIAHCQHHTPTHIHTHTHTHTCTHLAPHSAALAPHISDDLHFSYTAYTPPHQTHATISYTHTSHTTT